MKLREILVGIGVVVAAGIALFAYQSTQKQRSASVASARNLQQWGIALNLFLIDNDNQLPATGRTPISGDQTSAWFNSLPLYIGQKSLAELPSGSRPRPGVPSLWIDPTVKPPRIWDPEVFYFNYAMNAALQPDPTLRSYKIYEIGNPGNVIFLTEVDGYEPIVTPETVVFRHGGGGSGAAAKVLFCDGHVAPVPRSVLEDQSARAAAAAPDGVSWFE